MTTMPTGLTDRQRRFVDAFVRCRRGKQAAITAGYGEKWAASAASRLLKQPEIAAAVARRVDPPANPEPVSQLSPMEYLAQVMNDPEVRLERRIKAATALLPYVHARGPAAAGKKAGQAAAAKRAERGRFAPSAPPLHLVKPPTRKG
ncbi:terminase small subunit [Piscinibacter koreensis]|uniref:Terminase small subunit n=1 Tax=Piscinibacter koreensis TaxID=2742824 RepID=A0A7Y6NQR5_9BURK|nr:terminase small subunit [Schlegelella koreensis]NUZ07605.1 terminase small subunit [Schlegelella koreensis]